MVNERRPELPEAITFDEEHGCLSADGAEEFGVLVGETTEYENAVIAEMVMLYNARSRIRLRIPTPPPPRQVDKGF